MSVPKQSRLTWRSRNGVGFHEAPSRLRQQQASKRLHPLDRVLQRLRDFFGGQQPAAPQEGTAQRPRRHQFRAHIPTATPESRPAQGPPATPEGRTAFLLEALRTKPVGSRTRVGAVTLGDDPDVQSKIVADTLAALRKLDSRWQVSAAGTDAEGRTNDWTGFYFDRGPHRPAAPTPRRGLLPLPPVSGSDDAAS